MIALPSLICPRCGRHNVSRARFCAQCGLNLAASGASEITQAVRQTRRRSGGGLVLFIILMGLFLAAMGSLFRSRPCSLRPAIPIPRSAIRPMREQGEPWMHEEHRGASDPVRENWQWPEKGER
jgi:hypothetical protein